MPLASGTQLGPYVIQAPLGEGGMGEVHRARDTRLDRIVAIKVVRPAVAELSEFRRRFQREARATSALNHPHICSLYDIGEQDGLAYLVMEYVEGETLEARLRKGRLSVETVLRFGAQIADALDAAHTTGIIHRDLKPANIMITKSGVKVLDFGVAKLTRDALATSAATTMATQQIVGTVAYMAPEQIEGKDCDARTDIFALGLVLYEMASGKRAFSALNFSTLVSEIRQSEPALETALPDKLAHTIERCLAREPGGSPPNHPATWHFRIRPRHLWRPCRDFRLIPNGLRTCPTSLDATRCTCGHFPVDQPQAKRSVFPAMVPIFPSGSPMGRSCSLSVEI